MTVSRRELLRWAGRGAAAAAVGGLAYRAGSGASGTDTRFAWQINPQKCTSCGKCETACVRTPSAVKAVNDQAVCHNCVICYGHISNTDVAPDKVTAEGTPVCPWDAVRRTFLFFDLGTAPAPGAAGDFDAPPPGFGDLEEAAGGAEPRAVLECNLMGPRDYYRYDIDHATCTGCGKCTLACGEKGMGSLFLVIRPDLCLGCNECAIARACPDDAVERIPLGAIDAFLGDDPAGPGGAT